MINKPKTNIKSRSKNHNVEIEMEFAIFHLYYLDERSHIKDELREKPSL